MPALLKVVASPVGQGNVLQPTVFGGDAIGASTTWKVSRWVEQESYALVSNFTPDNFSRYCIVLYCTVFYRLVLCYIVLYFDKLDWIRLDLNGGFRIALGCTF